MIVVDLDDPAAVEAADPSDMLRAVASSAAQVREAAVLAQEADVAGLLSGGRPRAVVVCGMGGSAVSGDVLAAVAGSGTPVPVLVSRNHRLPAWVGAGDLVVAVSCSGTTEETLAATEEAVRRGCPLLAVGAAGSPLDDLARRGRAVFVGVPQGRQPRASVWALSTPLLLAGAALGMVEATPDVVEAAAVALEDVAAQCRVDADALTNPAKQLALELLGAVPLVWGTSPLAGVAAHRFASQLAENAKYPAVHGTLPEAGHNQIVVLDGPFGGAGRAEGDDLFRDRADDVDAGRLVLVLLRDSEEHPQVARRAEAALRIAERRGVPVCALGTTGGSAFERLARLVGLVDFASVYLAVALGVDPTPVEAIGELKRSVLGAPG